MKVLSWVLSIPVVLVLGGLAVVSLVPGYHIYVVRSESMAPAISMGDVVVTGPVHGAFGREIKPGTVVTYQTGTTTVTHRVLSVGESGLVTKGDAVEDHDARPIAESEVVGQYLFRIPKLGYLTAYMHTRIGWFLLIVIPAIVLEGFIIREMVREATRGSGVEVRKR
jgi:signal peptidase I